MSNKNIYNYEIKNDFLNEFSDNIESQNVYSYIFKISKPMEEALAKDLCEFNLNEIGNVIKYTDPLNVNVARSNASKISSYILWSIKKGIHTGENPLKEIRNDWFDQYVDQSKKLYFSESEIIGMEDKLVNFQDKIILRLLFEGISGQRLSEILNIKYEDVNFDNNILSLTDDKKGNRQLTVSDRCISFIRRAFTEEKYYNRNGEAEIERRAYSLLVQNNFLLRTNKTRTTNEERANVHLIYRRLSFISEYFGYENLTAKSIQRSGMLKMAYDFYVNNKKLTNEDLKIIAERFSVNKTKVNGYEIYSYSVLRQFINEENIELLYGSK
ncbi:site-specific integrase [Bacillus sp. JJ1533]|uniref:site-specific integrase n=1 Tax=Bacillus sp. JJ1533 TaxID=3122959 RepID=UPI003000C44D